MCTNMTSTKSDDFLSELKATLSKLTAYSEPGTEGHNVTGTGDEVTVVRSHLNDECEPPAAVCRRSVLYGELSSVLEKREQQQYHHQQQQQQQHLSDTAAARVVDLESRLKPGKSVVYLGSRRTSAMATPSSEHQAQRESDMHVVTSPLSLDVHDDVNVIGCKHCEEESNSTTEVTSTSSDAVCPSSNQGNQDSACVMSADESADSSDCSLLTAQQQEEEKERADKLCESAAECSERGTLVLSDDARRRHAVQHFATFPLTRPTPAAVYGSDNDDDGRPAPHDDVITTLMITHSGEPLSVGLAHQDAVGAASSSGHVVDRPLSVPVTVPEPTSFHQDGSQIRQQLLDHHRSQQLAESATMMHYDYERRCHRARRRRRRRPVAVHDSATAATTSDSEITSSQPPALGRNWRLSPSPVFHLLHHHHQASYCVNSSHKDTQRLQLNSPSSLLIDSSVDTDSQTLCQVHNI